MNDDIEKTQLLKAKIVELTSELKLHEPDFGFLKQNNFEIEFPEFLNIRNYIASKIDFKGDRRFEMVFSSMEGGREIYDLNREKELIYLKVKFLNKSNTCVLEAFFDKIEIYKIEPLSLDKKSNGNVEFKLYGSYKGVTYFKPNN
jgi:hypothetical protein